jgi:hypothetical protein
MAMILDIEKIPYKVLRRHKDWQKKRASILNNGEDLKNSTFSNLQAIPTLLMN